MKGFDSDGGLMPMIASDQDIVAEIDGTGYVTRKYDAMLAHATQIRPDGPFFASRSVLGDSAWSREHYVLAAGQPFPNPGEWADDVFAGLN
jgi:N-acetyl-1-D-myo-inositol-2-amino-2-deoxy-alpha-D-glucopyranoside deacetylase